jgi:hypothetical protein
VLNGRIGQVLGPFDATDLLSEQGAISTFTPETSAPILRKVGIQAATGTIIRINNAEIKIGKTGIYELDDIVEIKHLIFPEGADEDTIVDFVY